MGGAEWVRRGASVQHALKRSPINLKEVVMITFVLGVVAGIMLAKKIPAIKNRKFRFTKVVKFTNGKYAKRINIFGFYLYKDVSMGSGLYWWTRNSTWFSDCLVNTYEEAAGTTDPTEPGTPVDH